jgi:hypothetical protein
MTVVRSAADGCDSMRSAPVHSAIYIISYASRVAAIGMAVTGQTTRDMVCRHVWSVSVTHVSHPQISRQSRNLGPRLYIELDGTDSSQQQG